MTAYLFYAKHKGFDSVGLIGYTFSKSEAKKYMKNRNPEVVYMKVVKHVDEDYELELKRRHPSLRLHEASFYTKGKGLLRKDKVSFVCSFEEELQVGAFQENICMMLEKCLTDVSMLKEEYRDALSTLLYDQFFHFYKEKKVMDQMYSDDFNNFEGVSEFAYSEFQSRFSFDELAIFISLFGHTMRSGT